ncbi:MAG: VWA domain-containing protein [Bacteroidetes bacterium]|nr:MAG: VWA domain-containing protein [Bacteroidota bacterium]
MYRFEHPEYLYWLFSLIGILMLFISSLIHSKRKRKQLGNTSLVYEHIPDYFPFFKWIKWGLYTLAISLCILALANFQIYTGSHEVKVKGSDIIVCLDISNSMLAQDLSPNRLERAKMALQKMVEKLNGDKIGIVVFAGDAHTLLPLTVDYNVAKIFIQSINTDLISVQGTNVGLALQKAIESFDNSNDNANNKAIILITDGEDHDGSAVELTQILSEKNIPIHSIGIGSEQGAPIPIYQNGKMMGFKKDKDGNTVITKLNKEFLHQLSSRTNGIVVIASNSDFGLDAILKEIKKLDKADTNTIIFKDYESQYQWFLGIAILLLILDFLIPDTKPQFLRYLSKLLKI